MTDKKQKLTLAISLIAAFALGMATVSGCAYFSEEKVAGTASKVLEIAYIAGGATMVEQKIDQMVEDGKITRNRPFCSRPPRRSPTMTSRKN